MQPENDDLGVSKKRHHLVGGFNPFENIRQNGNLPQKPLKPPPRT